MTTETVDDRLNRLGRVERFPPLVQRPAERPQIRIVDAELSRVVDEAEAALLDAKADLYQRGGVIVRPVSVNVPAADGRSTVSRRVGGASLANIVEQITRAATFLKYSGREKTWRAIACPTRIAETYMGRGEWTLRPLAGIVTSPTIRYDDTILDRAGYDETSKLIFDPADVTFPEMPLEPTRSQAEAALALLLGLLDGFPFVDDLDRSVALAAILTATVRRSLEAAPLFGFTAPTAGCGKTLLTDIVAKIATGNLCPVSSQGEAPEELAKHLTAALLGSEGLLCIDNIGRPLGGDLLCQMLTQRVVKLRPLGTSTVVDVSTAVAVMATGNNLGIDGDLARRTLLCRLDAQVERPELRRFERKPLEEIAVDRGKYLIAALIVMRSYIAAGRPNPGPSLGSFERWCRLVRDPLVWLGLPDPVTSQERVRETDIKLQSLAAILAALDDAFGHEPVTAAAMIGRANEWPDLREFLLPVAVRNGDLDPVRLGNWLRANDGRIVDGQRVVKAGTQNHVTLWRCERV